MSLTADGHTHDGSDRRDPLPRCSHDACLMDGAGETLSPPCGCLLVCPSDCDSLATTWDGIGNGECANCGEVVSEHAIAPGNPADAYIRGASDAFAVVLVEAEAMGRTESVIIRAAVMSARVTLSLKTLEASLTTKACPSEHYDGRLPDGTP